MSDQATPQSTEQELIAVRKEKLQKLYDLGVEPFGSKYPVTTTPGELAANFENDQKVTIGGRLLAIRDMGKSVFFSIGDVHGRIQGYLNKKGVSELDWEVYQLLDLGDWIGIEGETFTTGKGEPSVKTEKLTILSKALRPMPDKWHGVSDRETKYRKRHLDLMSNQASADKGFLEVETPMLHDVAGGAAAKPFDTHHNALNMPLTLRIAPELHLKRLLCGGFTKIFELNRNFRNEGISRRHNPEFTMLEAYWAFSDFEEMADLVEEMTCHLAEKFCGGLQIEHKDEEGEVVRTIDLSRPWARKPYHDLIKSVAGDDWFDLTAEQRRAKCDELEVQISPEMEDAKLNKENPDVIDVYELIINGQEISPGYSELNDPILQKQRFEEQAGGETQNIDNDFVETMESGMPPAGGIGIGIDRLIMMLTGAPTIRDVVLFPQLKKKD